MNKMVLFIMIISLLGCKIDENKLNRSNLNDVQVNIDKESKEGSLETEKDIKTTTKDEMVGQLICIGIQQTNFNDELRHLIDKYRPGSIILFKRNLVSKDQLIKLNTSILDYYKKNNYIRPFIFIDQEGGRVDRLSSVYKPMNSASWYYKNKDARSYAIDLKERLDIFHIDSPLCPVLDTNDSKSKGAIGDRSFSNIYSEVSDFSGKVMSNMREMGIISVGKHFPGHGATSVDSHYMLPVIKKTYNDLASSDLKPFMDNYNLMDGLMLAHILVPAVDNMPVSLSKTWISKIREDGYNGVILSDDLTMGALKEYGNIEHRFKLFIDAGGDIGLLCHELDMVDGIFKNLMDLEDTRLMKSFERIMKLKNEKFANK